MKYPINNFKVNPKDLNNLENIIKAKLKINNFKYKILSKSIDARDKNNVFVIFKLIIDTPSHIKYKDMSMYEEKEIKGEFVLIVDGFKGEKQAKNNYDELSEREYVEVLINNGLSKKDAIKTVCKDRKLKKDVVYKQVLDL